MVTIDQPSLKYFAIKVIVLVVIMVIVEIFSYTLIFQYVIATIQGYSFVKTLNSPTSMKLTCLVDLNCNLIFFINFEGNTLYLNESLIVRYSIRIRYNKDVSMIPYDHFALEIYFSHL